MLDVLPLLLYYSTINISEDKINFENELCSRNYCHRIGQHVSDEVIYKYTWRMELASSSKPRVGWDKVALMLGCTADTIN